MIPFYIGAKDLNRKNFYEFWSKMKRKFAKAQKRYITTHPKIFANKYS